MHLFDCSLKLTYCLFFIFLCMDYFICHLYFVLQLNEFFITCYAKGSILDVISLMIQYWIDYFQYLYGFYRLLSEQRYADFNELVI